MCVWEEASQGGSVEKSNFLLKTALMKRDRAG